MNLKTPTQLISLFILGIFLIPIFSAHAITEAEITKLISLDIIPQENEYIAMQVVAISQPQLGYLANTEGVYFNTGGNNQAITTTLSQGCSVLTTDLVVGMSGQAVSKIQEYLKTKGHFTYPEITGYYGNVTKEAVQSFQRTEGIVSSGTPETTGYGIVGPRTRETMNKLLCADGIGTTGNGTADSSGNYYGYDLGQSLESYTPDFSYTADFSYDANLDYDAGFVYDADFSYDANLNYNPDFSYEANFDYELTPYDVVGDPIRVRIGGKDAESGRVFYGEGKRMFLESESRTVNVTWESQNADRCTLSGSFYEGEIAVPEDGDADVYLVNPIARYSAKQMRDAIQEDIDAEKRAIAIANGTYQEPTSNYVYEADFSYGTGVETQPVFGITISCQDEERYSYVASDTIYFHLDEAKVKAEQDALDAQRDAETVANTSAPLIAGITPDTGNFGREIFVIGTNFGSSGNTITIVKNGTNYTRTIGGVTPAANGSLRFTFPTETQNFTRANGNSIKGEKGNYTITITSSDTGKVSNGVTYKVQ